MSAAGGLRRIPFPREHGAWAMLFAASFLAWTHAWARGWPALMLTALFALAFAIQQPLRAVAEGRGGWRWIAGYGALLLAGTAWLALSCDVRLLLSAAAGGAALTGIDLALRRKRRHRTFWLRLAGGAGLTLVLPATLAVMHPQRAGYALVLWTLTLLYFVTRMLRVRRARGGDARPVWIAQVALYVGLAIYLGHDWASPWILAAFLPGTVSAVRASSREDLRAVGWQEVAHLAWFVTAVTLSYHVAG